MKRFAATLICRSAEGSADFFHAWRRCTLSPALPGVVSAEVPQVAFQVEAAETPAAVILVLDFDGNLGSGSLRAGVNRIGIGHDHIRRLSLAADFIGLRHQAAKFGFVFLNRSQHFLPQG